MEIRNYELHLSSLLIYSFANLVLRSLQAMFEKVDRDRSGRIDANELREALFSLGFSVSPVILDLLVSKFDKTGGKNRAIEYDNFIEYVLIP